MPSLDESQRWIIYHATDSPHDGWANRRARAQLLTLRDGVPYAGEHPSTTKEDLCPGSSDIGFPDTVNVLFLVD